MSGHFLKLIYHRAGTVVHLLGSRYPSFSLSLSLSVYLPRYLPTLSLGTRERRHYSRLKVLLKRPCSRVGLPLDLSPPPSTALSPTSRSSSLVYHFALKEKGKLLTTYWLQTNSNIVVDIVRRCRRRRWAFAFARPLSLSRCRWKKQK